MSSEAATSLRRQRTLRQAAEVTGVGFLTGATVKLRFLPAPAGHGIVFQRTDQLGIGKSPIPATIEFAVPRERRTAVEREGVAVEMTEHVLAALAGLRIDNCLVQLNAPEPPGCDGSSRAFVDALLEAGSVELDEPRPMLVVSRGLRAVDEKRGSQVSARPITPPALVISYRLDYGPDSPIPPQKFTIEITPESFVAELAFARTFVLESEVKALKAQGYGRKTTARDLLVFGPQGPIDNTLRAANECARHKVLDCLGDFALLGCDLSGHLEARRSGHRLNRELVRGLRASHAVTGDSALTRAA
ncbi:MAG TPA: UDP-3-O-acyl-N-acetylglucosamine deacetylase [Planctomycetaceae bacterium]|nr:UDP-3-O-acyl-N-acetylglucosamine deacetylase [Planctomycetaceae bacterium]